MNLRAIKAAFAPMMMFVVLLFSEYSWSAQKDLKTPLVEDKLSEYEIGELKKIQNEVQIEAPDGVFKAPRLKRQIDNIIDRFQATNLVSGRAVFFTTLGSAGGVNAWVSSHQDEELNRLSVFKMVLTKGIIDMLSNAEYQKMFFNAEEAYEVRSKSEGLLASIIAHEMGHAMNNDTKNMKQTTRVYNEVKADQFAVRLMSASGYDPLLVSEMLALLGKLHKNTSIRALIGEFMDEHPRASYRVASVAELIQHTRASTKSEGKYLGYRELDRSGKEVSSKNSKESFLLRVSKPSYQEASIRERINFLSKYFVTSLTKEGPMTRLTGVAIGEEYRKIVNETKSIKELNIVLDSIIDFESTTTLTSNKGDSPLENVKKSFKELHDLAHKKLLKLVDKGEKLALSDLFKYSHQFDQKRILAIINKAIYRAETSEEIEEILFLKKDLSKRSFNEIFKSNSSSDKIKLSVIRKATVALMGLERNPIKVIDRMYRIIGLDSKKNQELREVTKGVVLYVVNHNDIEWDDFRERMNNPKSAQDRQVQGAFRKDSLKEYLYSKRTATTGSDFTYGVGTPFKRSKIDKDFMGLLTNSFGNAPSVFNIILNDIMKNAIAEGAVIKDLFNEAVEARMRVLSETPKLVQGKFSSYQFEQSILERIPTNDRAEILEKFNILNAYDESIALKDTAKKSISNLVKALSAAFVESKFISNDLAEKFNADAEKLEVLDYKLKENLMLSTSEFTRYSRLKIRLGINIQFLKNIDGNNWSNILNSIDTKSVELFFLANLASVKTDKTKAIVNSFSALPKNQVISAIEKSNYELGDYLKLMEQISRVQLNSLGFEDLTDYKNIVQSMKLKLTKDKMRKGVKIGNSEYKVDTLSNIHEKEARSKNGIIYSGMENVFPKIQGNEVLLENRHSVVTLERFKTSVDWTGSFYKGIHSKDPIEALLGAIGFANGHLDKTKEESLIRTQFLMFSRAISLVKTEQQMKDFSVYLNLFLSTGKFNSDFMIEAMKGDFSKFSDMTSLRYRQLFFDSYIEKMDYFKAWEGNKRSMKNAFYEMMISRVESFAVHSTHFLSGYGYKTWYLKLIDYFQVVNKNFLTKTEMSKALKKKIDRTARGILTKLYDRRSQSVGRLSAEEQIKHLRGSIAWSVHFDELIERFIEQKKFPKNSMFDFTYRDTAMKWAKEIRSPAVRDKAYRKILNTYGSPSMGLISRAKLGFALFSNYQKVKEVFKEKTLEEMRGASSDLDRLGILHKAWKDYAGEKAAKAGISEAEVMLRLKNLKDAFDKLQHPIYGEISEIFPEGSRFRDNLLEEHASRTPMNFEEIMFVEGKKSYNTESPLHKFSKAAFEMLDEVITKLSPKMQAEMALYLAGARTEIDREVHIAFKSILFKGKNRSAALKRHGVYSNLEDLRELFMQTHPEERLVAFRALFVKGLKSPEALKILSDTLLFSDGKMPIYLEKVIRLYNKRANEIERAMFLSWILANSNEGTLKGPEIVKTMIEQGGVGAAKLAQLVASHGFRLPSAYREVLEKFKGKAQKIDKIEAMNFIKKRLPAEKFKQIKSLDRMFGAGSLKMAFGATLVDGRKVVVMLGREFIEAKVEREIELMRIIQKDIMADPQLRLDSLPSLIGEVERIIIEEMDFENEREMMKAHKRATDRRPALIKLFGNQVKVMVPQPLDGWVGDGIIVEEYVESKGFSELPERSVVGWTKKSLAKASINEIVNQMMVYMFKSEHEKGRIVLDIDPHEENQLAKFNKLGMKSGLVNIDLGQTVKADPKHVRDLVQIIANVYLGRNDYAVEYARKVVDFPTEESVEQFRKLLKKSNARYGDPIESLTEALEELQLKGVGLKPEYIYFQKLFSTMVGLKRHAVGEPHIVKFLYKSTKTILGPKAKLSKKLEARYRLAKRKKADSNTYMTRQIQKTMALRSITNFGEVYKEAKSLYLSKPNACKGVFK